MSEIMDLEAALCDQRIQAKIDFAEADAQVLCQLALGKAWVVLQCFEQPVMGRFVQHWWCVQ